MLVFKVLNGGFYKIAFFILITLLTYFLYFSHSLLTARAQFTEYVEIPQVEVKKCRADGPKDVECRCKRDECRLSVFETANFLECIGRQDLFVDPLCLMNEAFEAVGDAYDSAIENYSYICIPGQTTPSFRLGMEEGTPQEDTFKKFTSSNVYEDLRSGGAELRQDNNNSLVYLDLFAVYDNRAAIPRGSVCKKDPESGIAYWYYPSYLDVMTGSPPSDPGSSLGSINLVGIGGACSDVLFSSVDLYGAPVSGTQTFFGCLPNSLNGLVAFVVRLVTGLAIVITLIIIVFNLIQIITNSTNANVVSVAQKKMYGAVITLIAILLTLTVLNIIGIQIIGFGTGGTGGSIFKLFTGG